jgi:hypothetical protein
MTQLSLKMVLKNHIAYRFLTDPTMVIEIIESFYPNEVRSISSGGEPDPRVLGMYKMMGTEDQKAYYITETVLNHFDSLNIKKIETEKYGMQYDWSYFKGLKEQKTTFIFPNNSLLRLWINNGMLHFCHTSFKLKEGSKVNGEMYNIMLYVDMQTGELCEHFAHKDAKMIELFVYKLLAFFFLSENEMIIVEPGRKHGTLKSGKLINTFKDIPVTIVNSKWNITSIRTEGFEVKGHFALRWTGEGRKIPKMVFIEPFKKNGYMRKAQKENHL